MVVSILAPALKTLFIPVVREEFVTVTFITVPLLFDSTFIASFAPAASRPVIEHWSTVSRLSVPVVFSTWRVSVNPPLMVVEVIDATPNRSVSRIESSPFWTPATSGSTTELLVPFVPLTTLWSRTKPVTAWPRMAKFWKSLSCIQANRASEVVLR